MLCYYFTIYILLCDGRTQGSQAQLALQRLYDTTNGDSWTDSTGWNTGSDLNGWFGVTATSSTVVTKVELLSNNLAGRCVCFHESATVQYTFILYVLSGYLTGLLSSQVH
jgi:hypothetical protein